MMPFDSAYFSRLLGRPVTATTSVVAGGHTQCTKLRVELDDGRTCFFKHFPLRAAAAADDIQALHVTAQRNELAFFRHVAPALGQLVPTVVAIDDDDGALLLEFLDGTFFTMQEPPVDVHLFARFLAAYSRLHAVDVAPFVSVLPTAATVRENRQRRWTATAGGVASVDRMRQLCDALALSAAVTATLVECARLEYVGLSEQLLPLAAPSTRLALAHSDANPNNLMVTRAGTVVLFDFQEPTVDEPVLDLAWLAITSLAPDDRAAFDVELIDQHYFAALGLDDATRRTYLDAYRRALTLNAVFIAFVLGPAIAATAATSWPHRLLMACVSVFTKGQNAKVETTPSRVKD